LQKLLAFARFALHVVDRVSVFNIGVKAENHSLQDLRFSKRALCARFNNINNILCGGKLDTSAKQKLI
jgi:hypothetical protein